jgi:hypothetical protein
MDNDFYLKRKKRKRKQIEIRYKIKNANTLMSFIFDHNKIIFIYDGTDG